MENLKSNLEQLKSLIDSASLDGDKLVDKGNHSAGTRVRKAMQEVKVLAQEIRKDVLEIRNAV